MKKQAKKTTPAPSTSSVNSGQVNMPVEQPVQVNTPSPDPAAVTTESAVVNAPGPAKANKKASKPKAPSISASVRRIVVRRPEITVADLNQALINDGWKPKEVEDRKSTISTLRTDALAIIAIAKEEGCWSASQVKE